MADPSRSTGPRTTSQPAPTTAQFTYLLGPTILEGTDVAAASASTEETTCQWIVLVEFTSEARVTWAEYTAADVGENIAVTLGGRVISAPMTQAAINGETTITGDFSKESAEELAEQLGGG